MSSSVREKKPSRFRSERERERMARSERSVMGEIVEKNFSSSSLSSPSSSTVEKGILLAVPPKGFPQPLGRSLTNEKNRDSELIGQHASRTTGAHFMPSSELNLEDDYRNTNEIKVENMSESEIQSAMLEISSLMSEKNINFLRNRESPSKGKPRSYEKDLNKVEKKGFKIGTEKTESLLCSGYPRFDLSGRRIIQSTAVSSNVIISDNGAVKEWKESLEQSFLIHHLSVDVIEDISRYCIAELISSKFVVDISDFLQASDDISDELNNVQIGYSLQDACKLMSSEVKSQRIVGLRILNGAMSRRDIATSGESYPFLSNGVYDFSGMLHYIEEKLPKSAVYTPQDISRVVTFAILKSSCAEDFPPQVAYLVSWNICEFSASSSAIYQLQSIRAACSLLFSYFESVAGDVGLWRGTWGLYDGFESSFMTPLVRRPEQSYTLHVDSCLRKSLAAQLDKDHNQKILTSHNQDSDDQCAQLPMRPHEEFAMLCRWSRVDAMLDVELNGNAFAFALSRIAADSVDQIHDGCKRMLKAKTALFDRVNREFEHQLMIADVFIRLLSLLSDCIRCGSISSVDLLYEKIVEKIWHKLLKLHNLFMKEAFLWGSKNVDQFSLGIKLKSISELMWKIAAELGKRSKKYAVSICDGNALVDIMSITAAYLSKRKFQGRNTDESTTLSQERVSRSVIDQATFLWALRFWRCCIVYNIHMNHLSDLLSFFLSEAPSFSTFSVEVQQEICDTFEAAAVSCSVFFDIRLRDADGGCDDVLVDGVYIHLVQLVCQMTVTFIEKLRSRESDSWDNITLASCEKLIASVMGVAEVPTMQSSKGGAAVSKLLESYIGGKGLVVLGVPYIGKLMRFVSSKNASTEDAQSSEMMNDLKHSLNNLLTTMMKMKELYASFADSHHVSNFVFNSFSNVTNISKSDCSFVEKSYRNTERVLSLNRLAMTYYSGLLSSGQLKAEPKLCFDAFKKYTAAGDAWIEKHRCFRSESVAKGLHSARLAQLYNMVKLTHIQVLALMYLSVEIVEKDDAFSQHHVDISCWKQNVLCNILFHSPSLASYFPFTIYRSLQNIVAYVMHRDDDCQANCSNVQILADIILKKAYGFETRCRHCYAQDIGDVSGVEEGTDCVCLDLLSLTNLSISGFLFFDNFIAVVDKDELSVTHPWRAESVVRSNKKQHVRHSSLSKLCFLDDHWLFSSLGSLQGHLLQAWLPLLPSIARHQRPHFNSQTYSGLFAAYMTAAGIGDELYWLTRLPASDIMTLHDVSLSAELRDPLSPCEGAYQIAAQGLLDNIFDLSRGWSSSGGESSLRLLVVGCTFERVAASQNRSLQPGTPAQSDSWSSHASGFDDMVQSWIRNNSINFDGSKKRIAGIEDLCGRLMEGLLNQVFTSNIHAVSLSPFLIPGLFPWPVRYQVWRTIGDMKMVHLLETPLLSDSLALFLGIEDMAANYTAQSGSLEASSVSVVVAIVDSLLQFRNYHEERQYTITRIGVFTVAQFLFHRAASPLSGMKETILMKMVHQYGEYSRRCAASGDQPSEICVLMDVLKVSAVIAPTERIIGLAYQSKNDQLTLKGVSSEVLQCWDGAVADKQGENVAIALDCLDCVLEKQGCRVFDVLQSQCPQLAEACRSRAVSR